MNDQQSIESAPMSPVDLAHSRDFRIGEAEIRPATREVVQGECRELLEPRVMEVLVVLARAGGAILSRDDLIEACWDGRAVTDDAINRVICRLRALSRTFPSVHVETITKVGYRLVTQASEDEHKVVRREPAMNRICVLPFVNMSGDSEQEYFSDGITEDITTDLSKISALGVTARHTAFTFKGQAINVREVASKLGVSHVLEGSVRKSAGRVRINAQLIDGTTADHLWAERYDRDLTDIFAIQDEISEAIVAALKLTLLPDEKKAIEQRGTSNAQAYTHYLMARQYWVTGDFGDRRREERTIRLCQRAVEIDPDYAQAWALMGLAQANLYNAFTGNDGLDDGLAAAQRALALDADIAEAHLPLAWYFALRGDFAGADAEIQAALRLNPDCWEANKEGARILYRQGRLSEAQILLERACELAESDFHSPGMLIAILLGRGDHAPIRQRAERMSGLVAQALSRDPSNGAAIAYSALAHAVLGQAEKAREMVERAILVDPDNLYMRYNLAWPMIAFLGDTETALQVLSPALADGGSSLVSLAAADRNLDPIRADPRFREMLDSALARVGLQPKGPPAS